MAFTLTPTTTYRQWLQNLSDRGSKEANALLQVVGDDFNVNDAFEADPYAFTQREDGRVYTNLNPVGSGNNYGYGPQGLNSLNDEYSMDYQGVMNDKFGGHLLGATTTTPSRSGSSSSTGYSAADIANLQGQLTNTDRLLNSLGVTRDTGMTNISREYDKNAGRAREEQGQFNRNQNIRRSDNEAEKADSLNRINYDAENKFNSVMRMLGVRGAGVSSAAQQLAPHLVARQATNQRADQFNTFGRNQRAIDIAQTDSDLKYSNLFDDLAEQKRQKEGNFRTSLVNQENDLYGTRAQIQSELDMAQGGTGRAAYQDYNARLGRNQVTLDDLLREYQSPAYNYKAVDTAAPDMSKYTTDPLAVASAQQAQDPTAEDVNAYLPWLKRRKQDGLAGSY